MDVDKLKKYLSKPASPPRVVGVLFGRAYLRDTVGIDEFLYFLRHSLQNDTGGFLCAADFNYDGTALFAKHPALPVMPDNGVLIYHYPVARRRFPYLFADTNPILYRKFN